MNWWTSTRPLPVFGDSELTVRSAIHSDRCPSSSDEQGSPNDSPCRCLAALYVLQTSIPVCTLKVENDAVLVQTIDSGPFWVEGNVHRRRANEPEKTKQFVPLRRRSLPPDYLKVQIAMGEGSLSLGRRRRPIVGGEICFLRGDKNQTPWRFLGMFFDGVNKVMLIIDAELRYERGLGPTWSQHKQVPLVRDGKSLEPNQLLIPVFPLPDGTENPGWVD